MLRLVRRLPLPEPPRVVAVDDWALRKGHSYGTTVVNLERRRVVDLLPDRAAETLAEWLRHRPGIAVVARDRSTKYARGIGLGAPDGARPGARTEPFARTRAEQAARDRPGDGSHASSCSNSKRMVAPASTCCGGAF